MPNGCTFALDPAKLPFDADFAKMRVTAIEPKTGRPSDAAVLGADGRITFRRRPAGRGEDIIVLLKQE